VYGLPNLDIYTLKKDNPIIEIKKIAVSMFIYFFMKKKKNIIVAMMHTNPKGESKLLPACTLPLTGLGCVKKVVTELAVLNITSHGFELIETAPGVTIEEVKAKTLGRLIVSQNVREMQL